MCIIPNCHGPIQEEIGIFKKNDNNLFTIVNLSDDPTFITLSICEHCLSLTTHGKHAKYIWAKVKHCQVTDTSLLSRLKSNL